MIWELTNWLTASGTKVTKAAKRLQMTDMLTDSSNFSFSKTNTVLVIGGPTAVGKTGVAISLAQKLQTKIVSADSRQCYREMNIGTAKPELTEQAAVPHYFVDAFSIKDSLDAAQFETLALEYLEEIFKKAKKAIVVGGTGLYLKALTDGLDPMPQVNKKFTEEVERLFALEGLEGLQNAVKREDFDFFNVGEKQNPSRLIRALAFKRATGSSITKVRTGTKKPRSFRLVKICLDLPRELLYQRINERVDRMMEQGLLDEAKSLFVYRNLKNLQTVGYQELFAFLEGQYGLPEAVEKIKQHTRNYAKRQLTWFRNQGDYIFLRADDEQLLPQISELLF